ncbi:MAG: branched-chain amino acid ABC transporter permease [Candidatus Tectimicrobiota bacterium]
MDLSGLLNVLVFAGIFAGIYALLALGLNLQWGYTGLFNVGVGGFYAIGAYTSALLTAPPSPSHLGGLALPIPCGMLGAMLVSGLCAAALGALTLRLREDYLAIATISLAETLRLVLKNEAWLTNGVQGLRDIPRPLVQVTAASYDLVYLGLVVLLVGLVYGSSQCLVKAPWGRVLRAIREDELVAASLGKNVFRFKLQALILGAMGMGLGGSLYAHYVTFISPDTFNPLMGTFLVWVMLMAGGSGNNRGAIAGAGLIWGLWSLSDVVTSLLPAPLDTRASYLRVMLIALVLQSILVRRPQGLLPER